MGCDVLARVKATESSDPSAKMWIQGIPNEIEEHQSVEMQQKSEEEEW